MKLKAWKSLRVVVIFGLFFESLFATDVVWLVKAAAQDDPSNQTQNVHTLKLSSGYFATPIFLHRTVPQSITSFKLEATLTSGQGSGTLELNQTSLKFNEFGDVETVGANQSELIQVQFRKFNPTDEKLPIIEATANDPTRSLYELILQEGFFNLVLVVPESASKDCRLVVHRDGSVLNVIPLRRDSRDAANSEAVELEDALAMPDPIDLSSEYVRTEIGLKKFRIEGALGGKAKFYLDPNRLGFNTYGDMVETTLLGWGPRNVELQLQNALDPLGKRRKKFEIRNDGPRQARYFLVFSPLDAQHRLVIKREEVVILVMPLRDSAGFNSTK